MNLPLRANILEGFREAVAVLPIAYILTLMWWFPAANKYVPGIIGGSLLLYGLSGRWPDRDPSLQRQQKPVLLAFWLFFVACLLSYALNDGSWSELRALLVMVIYLTFFWGVRFSIGLLKWVLVVSALGFISLTFFQYTNTGARIGGFINPIPYATAVGSVAVVFLAVFLFSNDKVWPRIASGLLFILLIFALLMTKTRGVLLPVFLITVVFSIVFFMRNMNKRLLPIVMILTVITGLAGVASTTVLKDRLTQTYNEYDQLMIGNYEGSIGVRLQLWVTAGELFMQKPVLGHGKGYQDSLQELYSGGRLAENLYKFDADHFHNQLIDTAVKKGTLGALGLLIMFFGGMLMAWRAPYEPWLRFAGVAVMAVYAGASLTDVPLLHTHTIFLFFGLCFYLSATKSEAAAPAV